MAPISAAMRAVQSALYAPGPFFCYPWKFPLWYAFGCDYAGAFKNFQADHTVPLNLAAHAVCLVLQLVSNFALLACADPSGLLGAATAAAWAAVLLASPAPFLVSAASTVCLAAAALLSPAVPAFWLEFATANCVFEALALQVFLLHTAPGGAAFFGIAGGRAALLAALSAAGVRGALGHGGTAYPALVALLVVGMVVLSARDDVMGRAAAAAGRKRVTPFYLGLVGWLLALLLDAPWVFFWANAFLASAVQGVSHRAAGEEGTLVNLQASAEATTAHELSHTVYFPNLLLHTIYEKVAGGGGGTSARGGKRA